MRLLALLLLALSACPASAQLRVDAPGLESAPAPESCSRRVGLLGRPILEFEDVLRASGHSVRVATRFGDLPGLMSWNPEVLVVLRSGADIARDRPLVIDGFVRDGGVLVTEYTATQMLYEPGPLNYLSGVLIDDFWRPSGTACGGNAILVDVPGHPLAEGLPSAWGCSGDPMGTFHVFSGVDERLCVVLSVGGSDRDGDGRNDPVLGVTRVGLGSVVPFFSDFGNFQPIQDPRTCDAGPVSATCERSVLDEVVLQNVICQAGVPASCESCGDCEALSDTLAAADIANQGMRNALEGKVRHACEQLRRGRKLNAGNALCALSHQIDAQDGKHLAPASAEELRECIRALSEAENLRPALPLLGCGGRPALGSPGGGPRRP